MKKDISFEDQLSKIASFLDGFNATWIIASGSRLGILKAIPETGKGISVEVLANKLKYNQFALKIWCESAYSFGILQVNEDGNFLLGPHVKPILVDDDSLSYLAGFFWFAVAASREYNRFRNLLLSGETVDFDERSEEYVEGIAEGGKSTYNFFINVFIEKVIDLKNKLDKDAKVLEVGCGCGLGMIYLKKKFDKCKILGIDVDQRAIRRSEENIRNFGLSESISTKIMDCKDISFKNEFDLIYMTFTLHEISNPKVSFKNLRRSLKEGGYLVVLDIPYPEVKKRIELQNPVNATVLGLQFGEVLQGDLIISLKEMEQIFLDAGFNKVKKTKLHDLLFAIYSVR